MIDLDAAMGKGANDDLVEWLAAARLASGSAAACAPRNARNALVEQGVHKVIVGTAAFDRRCRTSSFCQSIPQCDPAATDCHSRSIRRTGASW